MASIAGGRVVVTRSEAQAADFAQRLREVGLVPLLFPVITFVALPPKPLDGGLDELAAYDWLIFTSVNGVEFFFQRLAAGDARPLLPRIAAVGSATADALAALNAPPEYVPETFTGADLARGLGALAGKRVLLPRARRGRPEIVALLQAQGATVDDVPLYDTVTAEPTPAALADLAAGFDVITFTSPSSVRNFWKVIAGRGPAVVASVRRQVAAALVACIGPSTADEARLYDMDVAVQPAVYTIDALIAAIAAALAGSGA